MLATVHAPIDKLCDPTMSAAAAVPMAAQPVRGLSMPKPPLNWLFTWDRRTCVRNLPVTEEDRGMSLGAFCADAVWEIFGLPPELQRLRINGRDIATETSIGLGDYLDRETAAIDGSGFVTVAVSARLLGGKGGFGALLRGQRGARRRIKNFDACRDLTGRRVRHAKAMERLSTWMEKKRRDDELVAALAGDQLTVKEPRDIATQSKVQEDLRRIGDAYTAGIEETHRRTLVALERGLASSSSRSSSSGSTGQNAATSSQLGTPRRPDKATSLDARYLGDLYAEDEDDSEDDQDERLPETTALIGDLQASSPSIFHHVPLSVLPPMTSSASSSSASRSRAQTAR